MSIEDAVNAPRFDGFLPGQAFRVEARIPDRVRDGLAAYGIAVSPQPPYNWHFGSIQVVARDPRTGAFTGVADARRGGYADGY